MLYCYQQHPPPDQSGPPPGPNGQSPGGPPPPPPRILVRMPISTPRLTYVLLAINILIFLYTFSLSDWDEYLFFLDWGQLNAPITNGEYYRLFTAMFLHGDQWHIFFNAYALYFLGRLVESLFGTARFALIYFLGGLTGSLASFIFSDPNRISVGASGAILALFGAAVVYFYHHRQLHGQAGRQQLQHFMFIILLNLALGFSSSNIDNAAHIGGFVGGFILAWFIAPAYVVKPDADAGGLAVVDENPLESWALPSVLYTVGLFAATLYAVNNM